MINTFFSSDVRSNAVRLHQKETSLAHIPHTGKYAAATQSSFNFEIWRTLLQLMEKMSSLENSYVICLSTAYSCYDLQQNKHQTFLSVPSPSTLLLIHIEINRNAKTKKCMGPAARLGIETNQGSLPTLALELLPLPWPL